MDNTSFNVMVLLALMIPILWCLFLGATFLFGIPWSEKNLSRCMRLLTFTLTILNGCIFVCYFLTFDGPVQIHLPPWFEVGGYQFEDTLLVDHLSVVYAFLTGLILSVITKFSLNYLHREKGFKRFFFLISLLSTGLFLICYAGTLDILFAGWELVGTTSVLLISFFQYNQQSVRNSLRAMVTYRLCDMGILAASAWCHHYYGSTDFLSMASHAFSVETFEHGPFIIISLFVLWASLGKSAQFPMCGWLPTAMEGPTPSSAIFYGALSIHLGPFLLLRCAPFWENSLGLSLVMAAIGFTTAVYATLVGRTRSDAKTMLAYATMTQLGIIYMEIAFDLRLLALIHIVANAGLRTWQFLRCSSLIHDFQENPLIYQDTVIKKSFSYERMIPLGKRFKIYVHALNGFHLDFILERLLVSPFLNFFKRAKSFEDTLIKRSSQTINWMYRSVFAERM